MPLLAVPIPDSAAGQRTRFAAAYSVLQQAIDRRAFPGAVFGVFAEGEVVALDGVGHFTYEDNAPVVTPASIYDIASVTKVVATTAAAMLLYDRGQLQLDQPLGDLLPGFVIGMAPGSGRNRVTLQMLLAHSSGLPAYARLWEQVLEPPLTGEARFYHLLKACLHMPLEAPPGARAEYSDIGFILLGVALEVLSGQKLAPFCMREIFGPLGLTTTRFCPPASWQPYIPPTEDDTRFRHRRLQGEVNDENCFVLKGATGHAGLFSNALDLLRFAQCILNRGRTPGGQPLFRPETVDLFAARQATPAGTTRALGWDTPDDPSTGRTSSSGSLFSRLSIGHLGYTGTSLWVDREAGRAVVLLTNRTWPDRSSQLIREVRPALHDAILQAL